MLYSIHCLDGGDRKALRAQHFQAHQDYLAAKQIAARALAVWSRASGRWRLVCVQSTAA